MPRGRHLAHAPSPQVELDYAEQPQNEDKDEQSAKTDIHGILLFWFVVETEGYLLAFQSLRLRLNTMGYYFTRR